MRSFTTQHGRDLEWVLRSPPLLFHKAIVDARWGESQLARNEGLASQLDKRGSNLERAVRRMSSSRLGEYFETILTCWVDEVPEAHLIAANVQAHGAGGTVGEFDLLFRRDRKIHHWELAVKFYLGYPDRSGPTWYGPNPADILRVKWKRMRKHQLRLANHGVGQEALRRLGIRERPQTSAFVKGYLYEALDPAFSTHHHPHANRDGLRGWWVHQSGVADYAPDVDDDVRWMKLPKLRWLSAARPTEEDRLGSLESIAEQASADHPLHVAGVVERDGRFFEVSRGFIVGDGWPHE